MRTLKQEKESTYRTIERGKQASIPPARVIPARALNDLGDDGGGDSTPGAERG